MKLKKIAAAAVAMAMAVSMMSVPVFADSVGGGTANNQGQAVGAGQTGNKLTVSGNASTGTATTEVKVIYSTDANQLSVTVPISVTFAVNADKELVAPTNYEITNNSLIPVHIANISVAKATNSTYDLTNGTPSGAQMKLTMKPNSGSAVTLLNSSMAFTASNEWDMAATGATADANKLKMTFEGSVGQVDASWAAAQNKDGVHLFTITYTIGAGTTETTGNGDDAE